MGGACFWGPRGSAFDHGIDEDQQLSGAGDERHLMQLTFGSQTFVESHELRVPAERSWQGRTVEGFAQSLAAAVDMAGAGVLAAVVVIGSQVGKAKRAHAVRL